MAEEKKKGRRKVIFFCGKPPAVVGVWFLDDFFFGSFGRDSLFFAFGGGGKETKLILTSRENEEKRHHCLQPERKREKIGKRREKFGSKKRIFPQLLWGGKNFFSLFQQGSRLFSSQEQIRETKNMFLGPCACILVCKHTCTEFFILGPFLFPGFRETSN